MKPGHTNIQVFVVLDIDREPARVQKAPVAVYLSVEAARVDYPNERNYEVHGPFELRGDVEDLMHLWLQVSGRVPPEGRR